MTRARLAFRAWTIDLLLPRRCVSCGVAASSLCSSCRSQVRPLRGSGCARCGAPTAWPVERCRECAGRRLAFASARSAVAYAGPVPALIRGWKERGLRHLVEIAAGLVVDYVERPAAAVITHVPPDPVRQLGRGRHPAESLAAALAPAWGLEHRPLLRRTRAVGRQTGLPFSGRGANVRGAFAARGDLISPDPAARRAVVLVDDVYTTGATASAAASALRAAGVRDVAVVTLARAVR